MLKKLLTYFEMLIVPHALQCLDGCFFSILPHLTFCFWHTEFRFKFFVKIHLLRELNIKVVGFVLKRLLTYFEMLIVPHALHCVDSCIFVFTSIEIVVFLYLPHLTQSGILFWFQCPNPPPPTHTHHPSPKFFLSDLAALSKFI